MERHEHMEQQGLVAERTALVRRFVREELGFDLVGFAPAAPMAREGVRLEEWLALGYHGTMDYMARNVEKRADIREILPTARTVIAVARNYYTPYRHLEAADAAKVSRYAWGTDYHRILPKRLKRLHRYLQTLDPAVDSRWYVDTGPVLEKQWAVRAGLGWMGKHSNVISRSHGSWLFLGVLITSMELRADEPIGDFCGTCTRCLDACPTGAIVEPYVVDASRCISFVTIEQKPKPEIDPALGASFDNWVFGCDVCQDVCPWNRFEQPTEEEAFQPRPGVLDLRLEELERMSDEEFAERFQGSPVKRATAEGLRRNARGVRAGNEGKDGADLK